MILNRCSKQIKETHDQTKRLNISISNLVYKIHEWKTQLKGTLTNRILVVDDEPFCLDCYCDIIKVGVKDVIIKGASNFDSARYLIKDCKWDMAIIDLNLKDMQERSGLNLIEEIRNDKKNSNCFIILMTGVLIAELRELAVASRANCYLEKPVSCDKLIEIINMCLLKST